MNSPAESAASLAIHGAPPVRTVPFAPWPVFDQEAIENVGTVLRSGMVNYWTGDECRSFEQEFAAFVDAPYAVTVANGTLALELALRAQQIGPGDEVVVPCRTFMATASCVAVLGATPVFADVDPVSQNVTAETIASVLSPRTKGVIVVHLAGWPCDMDPIMELAAQHDLTVVEDCAQAHGARYGGRPVGSIGHAAAFSFCQDKILTTGGEGGMLTTADSAIWERAWSYKDHGKSWQAVHSPNHGPTFRWLHESIGTNWRMTEMQAALGRTFLARLPDWVQRRRTLASRLDAALAQIPGLIVHQPPAAFEHSYYKYYVHLETGRLRDGWCRDDVVRAVQAEGIPCGSGTCPEVYLERAFDSTGWRPAERLPAARRLAESTLMFLVHPTLSLQDMDDSARALRRVLSVAMDEANQSRTVNGGTPLPPAGERRLRDAG